MLYRDYLKDKYQNTAVKLEIAEGVPCVLEYSKGKNLRNYEIYGNSVQDGTPTPESPVEIQSVGDLTKNLLYSNATTRTINGVTMTYDNGVITLNGTCTASANFDLGNIALSANTYTLSANANKVPVNNVYAFVQLYDSTNKKIIQIDNSNAQGYTTVTTSVDGNFLYRVRIDKGCVYDNVILRPQLELGSTATEYEPYRKYDIPVTVRGKNLFDYSRQFATPIIQSGLTIQYLEDEQCFLINGTSAATDSTYVFTYSNFKIIPNAYYSVSARYVSGSIDKTNCTTENKWSLVYFGKSDIPNKTTNWVGHELANTDTVSENRLNNCNYISRVWFYINPGIVFDNYKVKIQVELGSTATSYEPYRGETKHIYLDEPLRKIGDYADYIDFKGQRVVRKVGVLDNTSTKPISESLVALAIPTEEPIPLPALKTFKGTNIISVDTSVQPSNIKAKYVRL